MMRFSLVFTLVCILLLVFIAEGKKNSKSKNIKENKAQKNTVKSSEENAKSDNPENQDIMRHEIKQTSLPVASVAQTSLPAATKETDETFAQSGDKANESSGEDSGSGETDKEEQDASKPINVKSKVKYEKDKNKIAETVKKSVQSIVGNGKQTESNKGSTSGDAPKDNKEANKEADVKNGDKSEDKSKKENRKEDKKEREKKEKKNSKSDLSKSNENKKETETAAKKSKVSDKTSKRSKSKEGHHHHHHHHHHHKNDHNKKDKQPAAKINPANEPKIDYPTFNWSKDGNKAINVTARIPGWPGPANVAQLLAMSQMAQQNTAVQKDALSWPIGRLFNGSVNNQADIASLDKASVETTSGSFQRDKTSQDKTADAPASSTSVSDGTKLTSDNKNPVAETVASDTGEVPQSISKTADVKIPSNIPARCTGLVKLYSNGELTLMDYLKQLRKCKKADKEFNAAHPFNSPVGNAMLRASISKNGAALTKEAYKYALERTRNYVPSSKEKQAAEQILAKWRSNSFGNRDEASDGAVPDAIKNFMTGQTAEQKTALQKKQNVQVQTDRAIDAAKNFILGTITGRTGDVSTASAFTSKPEINADTKPVNVAINKKAMIANPKQSVATVIEAAHALIGDKSKGKAVLLAPVGDPNSLLASVVKKNTVAAPNTALKNKAKAMQMAKTAEKLNAALLSQLSPSVVKGSGKAGTDLLAALNDMAAGPETPVKKPLSIISSVQKRSLQVNAKNKAKRKKRSLSGTLLKKQHHDSRRKRQRRELVGVQSQIDNPIERSKLNKPIISAPKLMDRIRDMSMIIATP